MKLKLTATILPLLVLGSCSITFFGSERATRDGSIQHTASANITNISIDGFNGAITLVPTDGGLEVSGTTHSYATANSLEEATRRLGQMHWGFRESGSTLHLNLSKPDGGSNNAGSDLVLHAPSAWTVDVDTSNGNVNIEPGFRKVLVHTSNGDIDAAADGIVRLSTSNGNVELTGATADFQVKSSNGTVQISLDGDWSGMGIADSSNGKISVRCSGTLDCNLRADTSNGKVHVYGPPLDGGKGRLNLDTSNANISVTHNDKN